MTILNPNMDMSKPQGLSKTMAYEGVVVQNDDHTHHQDKRMLGRIQVRVGNSFDGVSDEMLPWAIPKFGSHSDGASATSGTFSVPKIGSKVLIHFQDGSPLHPTYAPYTMDMSTALKEREHNYPNRVISLFQNGTLLIYDTQSNEVFFRDPGNLHIYVLGDVNMKVMGNVVEKIEGNKTTHIKGNVLEYVEGNKSLFLKGNYEESISGNHSQYVDGSFLEKVGSSRSLFVGSSDTETIGSSRGVFVGSDDTHSAGGHIIRSGARIDDNPGGSVGSGGQAPATPLVPEIAALPHWPVVRGKKPDSTDDNPTP